MEEQRGLSDRYHRASPWPLFVALGLTVSEVGILLDFFPVAVFGLLVFGGSVAGILTESGYTPRPWPTLLGFGGVLVLAGTALVLWQIPLAAVTLENFGENGLLSRSIALVAAGLIMTVAGFVASIMERTAA